MLVVSLFLNQAQVYTHHFKYFVLVKYTTLPNIPYPFIIYHSYPNMLIYDDLESVNHHSLLVTQKLGACHNQAPPAPALRIDFLCQALDFALKTFACGLFPDRQSKNGTIQWKRSGDVSMDTQWYTYLIIFIHPQSPAQFNLVFSCLTGLFIITLFTLNPCNQINSDHYTIYLNIHHCLTFNG